MNSSPARIDLLRSYCLICFIVPAAILMHLFNDEIHGIDPGQDIRVNCAAVDAHAAGLDPYYVKNLKHTKLSYPYLPVTLDVFRPLCAEGLLQRHYRSMYLFLGTAAALLCALVASSPGRGDIALRVLLVLGGFVGFEWTVLTGNFAILTGLLTALVLALFRYGSLRRSNAQEAGSFACYAAGAAILGVLTSLKVTFFPLLMGLYFLPLLRGQRLGLIALGAGCFAAPFLISWLLYNDLLFSWIAAITGQISGQDSPVSENCNPSLLCLGQALAQAAGLANHMTTGALFYGAALVFLILGPLARVTVSLVQQMGRLDDAPLLKKLDRLLIENPQLALRVTTLSMFALYLCAPRVKEYAYFELAIYAAMLVTDLSAASLTVVLTCAIVGPALAMGAENAFVGTYSQLASALVCFWVFLLNLSRSTKGGLASAERVAVRPSA
jgi:hypothetical protein